jgi:hypothetical protein
MRLASYNDYTSLSNEEEVESKKKMIQMVQRQIPIDLIMSI